MTPDNTIYLSSFFIFIEFCLFVFSLFFAKNYDWAVFWAVIYIVDAIQLSMKMVINAIIRGK